MGEQFSEKDRAFIDDATKDVNVPYGERVYIKRYIGVADAGDPAKGIQAQYQYKITPVKAVIEGISPQDVMYSGGIYQIGDIRATLTQKLNFVDAVSQTGGFTEGDKLIYREHEYRVVGRVDPETLIDRDKVYRYVFRKIGNK